MPLFFFWALPFRVSPQDRWAAFAPTACHCEALLVLDARICQRPLWSTASLSTCRRPSRENRFWLWRKRCPTGLQDRWGMKISTRMRSLALATILACAHKVNQKLLQAVPLAILLRFLGWSDAGDGRICTAPSTYQGAPWHRLSAGPS